MVLDIHGTQFSLNKCRVSRGLQEDVMPRFVTSDDQPVTSMTPGSMVDAERKQQSGMVHVC